MINHFYYRTITCMPYMQITLYPSTLPDCHPLHSPHIPTSFFFFLNDPAPPEISPLPLHDALPISRPTLAASSRRIPRARRSSAARRPIRSIARCRAPRATRWIGPTAATEIRPALRPDRKSTRLNSSHSQISYAVFCLKKKKKERRIHTTRRRRATPKHCADRYANASKSVLACYTLVIAQQTKANRRVTSVLHCHSVS